MFLALYSMYLHGQQTPITRIGDLCTTSWPTNTHFDIIGQIAFVCDNNPRRITLIDAPTRRSACFWDAATNAPAYGNGDFIRVQGIISDSVESYRRQVLTDRAHTVLNLEIVGHAPLPRTRASTASEINSFATSNDFVHIDGVLASAVRDSTNAEWNWLVLKTETGAIRAAATERDYPLHRLQTLLDAEVRLRGILHNDTSWMHITRKHIILYGDGGLVVRKTASSPFAAPVLGNAPSTHRQKITGHVLGLGKRKVFIRRDNKDFVVAILQDDRLLPTVGDRVSVSGFAESGHMGVCLDNAICRVEPTHRSAPDEAMLVNPERMFTTSCGQAQIDTSLYGKVLRVRGRIANSTEGIRTDGRILLECGQRTMTGDIRHLLDTLSPKLASGCLIDLTGICLFELDTEASNDPFPLVKGFVLYPRVPNDIVIVRRPPWWTPLRLGCVIGVLLLAIVAILIWNRMLKVLSERRGRELAEEQITSARADLKVEERTRLAIELHDSISQTLTGVALQIDAATRTGKANPTAAEKFLATARTMLASCRQELRCCIWDLKSRTFDEKDMTEAVQKTLAPHVGNADVQIRFNVPRAILSESAAHDALRIIRELAVNALRHGHATRLRVAGECSDGFVRFSVRDDGAGFDTAAVLGPADGHFGLQGIRERIKDRNGTMEIDSAPGRGTKVTISFEADEGKE